MLKCSRCQELVNVQAINCPHCGNQLKAYGHPGIPLYQASDKTFLCDRCIYDQDDTCNFPQRPYAKTCTLFHDQSLPLVEENQIAYSPQGIRVIQAWCRRNQAVLILLVLLIISVLLTIS
jgi:hypothetical protein